MAKDSQTRGPVTNSYIGYSLFFVIISVGQKTIEKCYANQRCHYDYIGNAFGVQHIILKGVYGGFHINIPEMS
jgi:hypothetical protein